MAGTVTVTRYPKVSNYGMEYSRIHVAWTSDASGDATGSITKLHGYVIKAITDPTDAPTANYDITLIDENGSDAMESTLLNRHTTNTETVYPAVSGAAIPVFLSGDHTFTVAAAGNAKSGVCVLYIKENL